MKTDSPENQPEQAPDARGTGEEHPAPKTGIKPISEWGSACGRGFVSNERFGSGQVIKRTNRNTSRKWRRSAPPENRS